MEKVREFIDASESARDYVAALAEVEEWEQTRAALANALTGTQHVRDDYKARAMAAEAERDKIAEAVTMTSAEGTHTLMGLLVERDRLKAALANIVGHEMVQSHPYGARTLEIARAALDEVVT